MISKKLITEIVNNVVRVILNEYYVRVDKKEDAKILKNCHISVYINDRPGFTLHCHVYTHDGSTEIEISLIDWSVVNAKCEGKLTIKRLYALFMYWVENNPKNKERLYNRWDLNNGDNTIGKYIIEKQINADILDPSLINYLQNG